jgi:ubiquinone/menaquinone biosynthesis C-methylase UbiE
VFCHVTAVDLSAEMLKVAARNVAQGAMGERIRLRRVDAKALPYADRSFSAVISNSIVHHIPEPKGVLAEMLRVLRPDGLLFVRDLLRPANIDEVDRLVDAYAGLANAHQRQMFRDSLCAALTLDELAEILAGLSIPRSSLRQTSDRHWTISGGR